MKNDLDKLCPRSQALPGTALPRGSASLAVAFIHTREAEPLKQCGPRQSLGPRTFFLTPVLAVLCLSPIAAAADSPDELRLQAEAAFRAGAQMKAKAPDKARAEFARSAELYEQLRQGGAANADLFRNQGNAYLLADDLPHAMLAYRRGVRLAPHDLALRRNLVYAREEVRFSPPGTLGRPPVDHRPPWLPRLPDWTVYVAFALYVLAWLAAVRWWLVRRGGWLTAAIGCLLGALVVGAGVGYEEWAQSREEAQPLVVIARDGVRLSPGTWSAPPPRYETSLNRGVEARLLFDGGRWLQIELSGGEIGWVPASAALVDR
jgi:tetratricopeptide (TPR) repeat protein